MTVLPPRTEPAQFIAEGLRRLTIEDLGAEHRNLIILGAAEIIETQIDLIHAYHRHIEGLTRIIKGESK